MRLAAAWVLAITSGSTSLVADGFQFSPSSLSHHRHAIIGKTSSSSMSVAAAVDEAVETSSMTYTDVTSLTFRELQRECKGLGLSAVGTTAALRGRLLEHFGLSRANKIESEAPMATPEEIEVRMLN